MRALQELLEETRPFAKENKRVSWWHLLSTLAIWVAFIAVTASDLPLGLRFVASIVLGLVTVRIFIIYHDFQHGAIFRDSAIATWFLNLFGVIVLNPPRVWKRSHNYHHNKNSQIATASIGSFPIMTIKDYQNATPSQRLLYRLARSPLPFLTGHVIIFVVGMCLKSFYTDPRRHFDSMLALILHVALIVVLANYSWSVLFLTYILPLYLACGLGAYLFYIQHNFPDMKLKKRVDWDFTYAALNSSSYMTGSWLTHWFTGNIGYHHVHHLNSRIPFYNLPQAMAAIPDFQSPGTTSLLPLDVYRCMRLKLWDPEQDKMLSFSEAGVGTLKDYFPFLKRQVG